jgi:hypothetical protein
MLTKIRGPLFIYLRFHAFTPHPTIRTCGAAPELRSEGLPPQLSRRRHALPQASFDASTMLALSPAWIDLPER